MILLELSHLSKSFMGPSGAVHAVEDVTLTVEAGEFVAVRGSSGCGKTTLLLAAGGLLVPDGGEVRVAGENPYRLSPEERAQFRAKHIGFVFQQFHLVPYLNVLDNILVPELASVSGDCLERARALAAQFGLGDRLDHVPSQLSTGERQRTALARALLNKPQLVLADEPTGNLDQDNARAVLNALADFARAGGAVLLVTHDPLAAEHAIRSIEMKKPD
ncbi:MAG: ABC transporter [Lentisphaerae bacterium RIFOXYA12_FULL_48_11]|nr:MAG: ABC transporter [Lentisphaerae bacterium RIFOXYA12_FULL_48_11]